MDTHTHRDKEEEESKITEKNYTKTVWNYFIFILSDVNELYSISLLSRPKKYSEKMKAEASVLQRIGDLQKEGMWYDKRLPKVKEPERIKTHWDYVLEEAMWMQMDFHQERKWKQMAAKRVHFVENLTAII